MVISHVLAALAKHDRSFVSGFKGARAGEADWMTSTKFDDVWKQLRAELRDIDASDGNAARTTTSDTFTTTAAPTAPAVPGGFTDTQMAQITQMCAQVCAQVLATQGRPTGPPQREQRQRPTAPCADCGVKHRPDADYGCLGKAIATGKLSVDQAKDKFSWGRDPKALAESAKDRYMRLLEHTRARTLPIVPHTSGHPRVSACNERSRRAEIGFGRSIT